ncbi:hypothetical protein AB0I51_02175 [Streptomyces sp. NPDC050549]|uniref:hypothetical protein n=1 Tax=Streptomyces sp. NPDC050549 TaxID=3155406 RepID=UPI00343756DA
MKIDWKDAITRALLGQLVGALVRFAFGASGILIVWIISGQVWPAVKDLGAPLGIFVASGGSILINHMLNLNSHFRCRYDKVDFKFEMIEKEITYERNERGVLTYRRRYKVKALTSDLEGFMDKFLWTGAVEAPLPQSVNNDIVRNVRKLDRPGIWVYFSVDFHQALKKGEEVEFELIQVVNDADMKSRPFFSTSIDEPTRRLVLTLKLPEALTVNQCHREMARGIESYFSFYTERQSVRNGYYQWVIKKPRLYHHYRIFWTWPQAAPRRTANRARSGGQANGAQNAD